MASLTPSANGAPRAASERLSRCVIFAGCCLFALLASAPHSAQKGPAPAREPKIWIQADHSFVCPADGSARLPLKVRGVSEICQPRYSWSVNGGFVEGGGAEIVWNLFGVRPQADKYYDAVVTVNTGPACGSRKLSAIWRACVVCPPYFVRQPQPQPPPKNCPVISFGTRAAATAGQDVPITATLGGVAPEVAPKFRWTVLSGGRLNGGQNTDSILVGAGGAGQTILAKVEVRVYRSGPPCSATCSIPVVPPPHPTPTPPARPVLSSVKLTPAAAAFGAGTRQTFTARAFDQSGRPMSGVAFTFESANPGVATVEGPPLGAPDGSATAIVRGQAGGTTRVTVTALAGGDTLTSDPVLLTVTKSPPATPATPTPTPPATLRVSVSDARDGRPIGGAQVVLDDGDAVFPPGLTTDGGGNFELTGLSPGEHRIKVTAPGFVEQERCVTLGESQSVAETFLMAPAGAAGAATSTATSTTTSSSSSPSCGWCCSSSNPRRCQFGVLLGLAALCVGAYLALSGLTGAAATAAAQDEVHCAVFGPKSAHPGDSFILPVFAHLAGQEDELEECAAVYEAGRLSKSQPLEQMIERDSRLFFSLQLPGLEVDEQEMSLVWKGQVASVEFCVTVPEAFKPRTVVGTAYVSVTRGEVARVPIGHVKFMLKVTAAESPQAVAVAHAQAPAQAPPPPPAQPAESAPALLQQRYVPHRRAFISYCSVNRAEVNKRVQGLRAAGIECFMDKMSLTTGAPWEVALYQFIDQSDIFYLFWSRAASESGPVMNEIEYALKRKGDDWQAPPEIIPVPLEPTTVVKPPEKLQKLHFDDLMLALITAEEAPQQQPPAPV